MQLALEMTVRGPVEIYHFPVFQAGVATPLADADAALVDAGPTRMLPRLVMVRRATPLTASTPSTMYKCFLTTPKAFPADA